MEIHKVVWKTFFFPAFIFSIILFSFGGLIYLTIIKPNLNLKIGLNWVRDQSKRSFLQKLCLDLKNEFKDRFISLVVFGSVARGVSNEYSDLDLLIVIDGNDLLNIRKRVVHIIHKNKISNLYQFDIDLYLYNRETASNFKMIYLDMCTDAIITVSYTHLTLPTTERV